MWVGRNRNRKKKEKVRKEKTLKNDIKKRKEYRIKCIERKMLKRVKKKKKKVWTEEEKKKKGIVGSELSVLYPLSILSVIDRMLII